MTPSVSKKLIGLADPPLSAIIEVIAVNCETMVLGQKEVEHFNVNAGQINDLS
jgi:hypothetical protein